MSLPQMLPARLEWTTRKMTCRGRRPHLFQTHRLTKKLKHIAGLTSPRKRGKEHRIDALGTVIESGWFEHSSGAMEHSTLCRLVCIETSALNSMSHRLFLRGHWTMLDGSSHVARSEALASHRMGSCGCASAACSEICPGNACERHGCDCEHMNN